MRIWFWNLAMLSWSALFTWCHWGFCSTPADAAQRGEVHFPVPSAARWGIGGASPMVQWLLSWVSPPGCLVLMRFALDLCWCQLLGQKVLAWVSFCWGWGCQKMLVLGHILLLGGWQGDVNLLSPSDAMCRDGNTGHLLFPVQVEQAYLLPL